MRNKRQHSEKTMSVPTTTLATLGWRAHLGVICILAAVAALLYYPSLHAPWYMDDPRAIVENPIIRDLSACFGGIFQPRGLAFLSFALNFRFGGTDPFGYHLVNLGLHIACGIFVYLLLQRVVREGALLPVLGALLFVAHPLQTQAVTYVVQRMTVLATLFFLLALWLFVRARERLATGVPFVDARHLGYYAGAILAGLAALFTKENTVVLPAVLYLYVTAFLPPAADRRRLLLSLLPFTAGPLILATTRLLVPLAGGESLANLAHTAPLVSAPHLTPLRYLVTEFSVLWIYIRMLFVPYGQTLNHNYPVVTSLFEPYHLLAGVALVLLGAMAVRLRRRQPLIAVGIAWFLLTLAVESSLIPLDPLSEHRLYLPVFGFVLVLLGLLRLVPDRRVPVVALIIMVLVCLPLTWQRNRLWADPIAFYRDNLAKAPDSERALSDLAAMYLDAGRLSEAEPLLLRTLERNPDHLPAYINLMLVYSGQGRLPEAFALARQGLKKYPQEAPLLRTLSTLYYKSGDLERALLTTEQALAINPQNEALQTNRAFYLAQLGRLAEAEAGFREVLNSNAGNVSARNDLALALMKQDKTVEAEQELRLSLTIAPDNRDALYLLGRLAISQGDHHLATTLAQRLQHIDPQRAQELVQLIGERR